MKKNDKPKLSIEQVKEIITKEVPLIFMVGALVFTSVALVFMNQGKPANVDTLENPTVLQELLRNLPSEKVPATVDESASPALNGASPTSTQAQPSVPAQGLQPGSTDTNPVCSNSSTVPAQPSTTTSNAGTAPACTGQLPSTAPATVPATPKL
jgi:hypothetical protein